MALRENRALKRLFGYHGGMSTSAVQLSEMIIDILTAGERRELSMVVAIRRRLNLAGTMKGDLTSMTKSGLRKLVASGMVLERDGVYTLSTIDANSPS